MSFKYNYEIYMTVFDNDSFIETGLRNALKHGYKGTFTWKSWAVDIGAEAAFSLIFKGTSLMIKVMRTATGFMMFTEEMTGEVLDSPSIKTAGRTIMEAMEVCSKYGSKVATVIKTVPYITNSKLVDKRYF